MQWTLMLAALIVVVLAGAIAIGWKLPAEHRVTREAEYPQPVESVWAAIGDLSVLPRWMPGVRAVQRLDAVDGRERWLYHTAEGDMTIEVVARMRPSTLVTRSVTSDSPFGGVWTHKISPTATGSLVTITETAWIANPFFRFMFRYVFGYASTLDAALVALARHLGGEVAPRAAQSLPVLPETPETPARATSELT